MSRVVILQEVLAQYRLSFYEILRDRLAGKGVELSLVHGRAVGPRAAHRDEARLPWATTIDNKRLVVVGGHSAVWQPAWRHITAADLVVVEQANRMLINYPLLARSRLLGRGRVAFWGHGANLQAAAQDSARERFKGRIARLPHWWFAYTEGSARRVEAHGFPQERITVVQNAVDTSEYAEIDVERHPNRCVFLGSLHRHKRLEFLLEASAAIAEQIPDFELHVVGSGAERDMVETAARRYPWLTYHGALFGHEKAVVVSSASLMLMPGLVGLAVVESFAARTPLVTTNAPFHSPEIEYLTDGASGAIYPSNVTARDFAVRVSQTLRDEAQLTAWRKGCAMAASRLTVEAMAERFADGLELALRMSDAQ